MARSLTSKLLKASLAVITVLGLSILGQFGYAANTDAGGGLSLISSLKLKIDRIEHLRREKSDLLHRITDPNADFMTLAQHLDREELQLQKALKKALLDRIQDSHSEILAIISDFTAAEADLNELNAFLKDEEWFTQVPGGAVQDISRRLFNVKNEVAELKAEMKVWQEEAQSLVREIAVADSRIIELDPRSGRSPAYASR